MVGVTTAGIVIAKIEIPEVSFLTVHVGVVVLSIISARLPRQSSPKYPSVMIFFPDISELGEGRLT